MDNMFTKPLYIVVLSKIPSSSQFIEKTYKKE